MINKNLTEVIKKMEGKSDIGYLATSCVISTIMIAHSCIKINKITNRDKQIEKLKKKVGKKAKDPMDYIDRYLDGLNKLD